MDFNAPPICFCRNPESFSSGSVMMAKLHTNRPKVWFRNTLPWLPQSRFEDLYFFGVNKWSAVANVEATKAITEGSADWIITCTRIDGRGQVLADMMLPGPRPQHGRFDATEDANERQFWLTSGHEGGHGYGLVHFDSSPPPEWMEPRLNMGLDGPQAAEAKLMASWFGEPKAKPVDPLPPSVAAMVCTMKFRDDGKTVGCEIEASKPGYSATLKGSKPWVAVAPATIAALNFNPPADMREDLQ